MPLCIDGQTGSGKTHSIMGSIDQSGEDMGIIPRAIQDIFSTLSNSYNNSRMSSVRVSMMEIYNEECKDLLHIDIPSKDIVIREDKDGRIFFTGAREEAVSSAEKALYFLDMGNMNRSTAETMMNQASSRSHVSYNYKLVATPSI